ncbi:MAG: hypothetical protein PHW04_02320 [Candidatus Wallbacteria bacterium]|nr:hypothetical protein [Candidatus Wallbacteria bacterium]
MRKQEKLSALIIYNEPGNDAALDDKDTLVQVEHVSKALTGLGVRNACRVFSLDFPDFSREITREKPDFVFNLVESLENRDSLAYIVPEFLEILEIPYTGASSQSMYLCGNKLLIKKILLCSNIPAPSCFCLTDPMLQHFRKGSYILKSVSEHASSSITDNSILDVTDADILRGTLLELRNSKHTEYFAEQYIPGREFSISLIGDFETVDCLPVVELRFHKYPDGKPEIYSYQAKWDETSFEYQHVERLFEHPKSDLPLIARIKKLARSCWTAFHLKGYARMDFRVDVRNRPWLIDINVNPCISPDSTFFTACEQAGYSYQDMVKKIVKMAVSRSIF